MSFINATDPPFSAEGNGTTLNRIRVAIEAANRDVEGGPRGIVFFPPGKCLVEKPIFLDGINGVTIEGSGQGGSLTDEIGTRLVWVGSNGESEPMFHYAGSSRVHLP